MEKLEELLYELQKTCEVYREAARKDYPIDFAAMRGELKQELRDITEHTEMLDEHYE